MTNLIIGGTGTLGNAVADKLMLMGEDVTVLSRDELKAKDMKSKFGYSHKLKTIIGDVRDYDTVHETISRHNNIYLFAAMKHVDQAELFPREAYKTNVIGAINVLNAIHALKNIKPRNLVFTSTDKAVAPLNAYGASKMMAEKILLAEGNQLPNLRVSICRYGNVLGSRGSVLKIIVDSIKNGSHVKITNMDMTRFWIKISDAADFVIGCMGERGLHIPKMKASKLTELVCAVAQVMGKATWTHEIIGMTPGEKLHESLDEKTHSNTCPQYTRDELVELIREDVLRMVNA
jgi:UDP-glucose 4-epimerase